MMQEINPSVGQSIVNTSNYLNGANKVYQDYIRTGRERVLNDNGVNIELLLNEIAPENILFEILFPLGFNSAQIGEIYKSISKQSGKHFYSQQGWKVIKDRKVLLIEENKAIDTPLFKLSSTIYNNDESYILKRDKKIACCDADKLKGNLQLRKWQMGDKFTPLGMKGRKLVSDFMTDCKFSISQKENQWILLAGEEIVWVVGERMSDRFKVCNNTSKVIEFRID